MRTIFSLFICAACAVAEVKTMTLRQALDLALAQNPDLMLARLDQQKSRHQVTIARDPFSPKVFVGSGAAYSTGFPASIDGAAPSIFQARTQMALFDRPQTYQIAQAKENAHTIEIDSGRQEDEIAFRVASLFLDAEQAALSQQAAQREAENLARVLEIIRTRVSDGRELPIEATRADLSVKKARYTVESLATDQMNAESSLALVLGLGPDDRVRAASDERPALAAPVSEDQSIEQALANSRDLKKLESTRDAKLLEIKGYKAMRLPKVNLIAQYELFAKYYYQNYYPVFQRNSAQFGASFEVPVLMGRSSRAYISQAEADIAKSEIEATRTRARITSDMRRAFQEMKRSESAREVAKADLELAREQVNVDLAQNQEGRLPATALEQARAVENEKWLAYYDAQHTVDRARLNVLRLTGTLTATLRNQP
jgi:outer membrane protein